MPIDTAPEGAELLHPPVVKPFPEFSPKAPHPTHYTGGDGHNHDYDTEMPQGTSQKPGLGALPPG
jgi:hypothetical protein